MIADAQGIRHNRQRRIDRPARREETPIDHVQVIDLVRFTIPVQRGRFWIGPEPDRAVLVSDARQGNALSNEEIAREQPLLALVPVDRALRLPLHHLFQLRGQTEVTFAVVGLVAEDDIPLPVERDAIIGIG